MPDPVVAVTPHTRTADHTGLSPDQATSDGLVPLVLPERMRVNMRSEAQRYVDEQYRIVPLKPGTKEIHATNWGDIQFRPDDVGPDDNLGIQCTGDLVDVDVDCYLALKCADEFLPPTDRVHGRASKLRSHRWYLASGSVFEQFRDDIDGAMLIEIRTEHTREGRIAAQTVVPPSRHPSGERITWHSEGKPTPVDAARLRASVLAVATVALIARHWPHAARHELRLAYARVLLETLGLSDDEARKILKCACRLGGSDDQGVRDVAQTIADTRHRLDAGEPATGEPTVARLLSDRDTGRQVVRLLRKWYGKTDHVGEAIETLNNTHAIVWPQSGDGFVVLTEDTEDGQPHLRFSPPSVMPLLYPKLIQDGNRMKPLGSVWLTHPQRRFYRGIEVAPNGSGNPGYYNMWRGFAVEPKKGEWPLFRQHLQLVANHNEQHARYILAWMAETVQHPNRPIGIALAFRGEQGTGKSTFAKWFGALFGVHFLHLDSEQHLLGRFNAHLHNTILLLADEAVWAGSKAGLGALKRMITEDTLNIERKNVDILTVKNMLHMMVASNEKWVVPAGWDNRRFAIFGTSKAQQSDATFFTAVHRELFQQGGLAALLYDLLEHTSDVNLQRIPETSDLQEQKVLSADPEEQWWVEKLHQGLLGVGEEWPDTVRKDVLHADYLQFLDKHFRGGRQTRATETTLGTFLKKRTPLRDGHPTMFPDGRKRVWFVPSLAECRVAWVQACKWPEDYAWGE